MSFLLFKTYLPRPVAFYSAIYTAKNTFRYVHKDPVLSKFAQTQLAFSKSFLLKIFLLSALSNLPIPNNVPGYFLNLLINKLLPLSVSLKFSIQQLVFNLALPNYIQPVTVEIYEGYEEYELPKAPTQAHAPIKDWIALNVTHFLLLQLFLSLFESLTLNFLGIYPSLMLCLPLKSYVQGFLLYQYALIRDGKTPQEIVNLLTSHLFLVTKLGITSTAFEFLAQSFLWSPLARCLCAAANFYSTVHANGLPSKIFHEKTKQENKIFDPIYGLWQLNQFIFDLFKGKKPNPHLGQIWANRINCIAEKINQVKINHALKFLFPIFLKLCDIKNSASLFSERLSFITQDLKNLNEKIINTLRGHQSEINITQSFVKIPVLSFLVLKIGRAALGNSLTQLLSFALLVIKTDKLNEVLSNIDVFLSIKNKPDDENDKDYVTVTLPETPATGQQPEQADQTSAEEQEIRRRIQEAKNISIFQGAHQPQSRPMKTNPELAFQVNDSYFA